MDEFKKNFTKVATNYAKYVDNKIETQSQEGKYTDNANYEAIMLMNEVRTVNVIAVTLTRLNKKQNEEHAMLSAN